MRVVPAEKAPTELGRADGATVAAQLYLSSTNFQPTEEHVAGIFEAPARYSENNFDARVLRASSCVMGHRDSLLVADNTQLANAPTKCSREASAS
jgi:hypothetical protein